jgi:GTP-binding protein HflX
VLAEIGADSVPEFLVFNKVDKVDDHGDSLVTEYQGAVAVSAKERQGLDVFLRRLADRMRAISQVTELLVPFERGDVVASIHREGEVVSIEEADNGLRIRARLSQASAGRLREFVVGATHGGNLNGHV